MQNMGDKISTKLTNGMATWRFVIFFLVFISIWMWMNVEGWIKSDPFPFILLNLMMSTLASIQAPIIMMDTRRGDKVRDELLLHIKLQGVKILELEEHILEMKENTKIEDK